MTGGRPALAAGARAEGAGPAPAAPTARVSRAARAALAAVAFVARRRTVRGSAAVLAGGMALGTVAGLAGLGALDQAHVVQDSAGAILAHNLVFAAGLLAGIVTFGFTTVLLLAFGGWLIGSAVGASVHLQGLETTALGLLPHASAELLALVLLGAVGLSSLDAVLVRLRARPPAGGARAEIAANLALGAAGVALLSLAAVIEAVATSQTATL